MGDTITIKAADGHEFSAYVAEPAGDRRGTVVVLQEIFGVNRHMRAVADRFASEGYRAVVPALFDRVEAGVEMGYDQESLERGKGLMAQIAIDDAVRDVAAVAEWAKPDKVAVVGYCWGGTVAWAAATRLDGLSAVVSLYGGGVPGMAEETPNCPIQIHFGETDHSIPMDRVEAFRQAQPDLPVHLYPAGHGFACDERASYHEESDRLAHRRAFDFLNERLG